MPVHFAGGYIVMPSDCRKYALCECTPVTHVLPVAANVVNKDCHNVGLVTSVSRRGEGVIF